MMTWVLVVLAQLPPGVEAKTLIEKEGFACPARSQTSFCDDPGTVLPTVDFKGELDKVTFVAQKPGRTTCSCGLNVGFRFVWQFTVITREEGIASAAKRVAERALSRVIEAMATQ